VVDHPYPRLSVDVGEDPVGGAVQEDGLVGGAVHVPREGGLGHRDDDCESGHGPSLPMSPHSGPTGT